MNLQNIPSHNKDIRKMFKATNREWDTAVKDDTFLVDRWNEIMTKDGWKCANRITTSNVLLVDEDGVANEYCISNIERCESNIKFYVYKKGGDVNE